MLACATAAARMPDRVGLGWRASQAASIQQHLGRIDVLEVIADDWFERTSEQRRALRTLARQVPLSLHGVAFGMASAWPVAAERLEAMARLVGEVEPDSWSEHLAFVRADGHEIGHLAAPPRTPATVAGTLANLERARAVVGAPPTMENVATLIEPPASTLDECAWLSAVARGAAVPLLLDLHNLYANACNTGADPVARLAALPLERVSTVHLAGGRWIGHPQASGRRLLDDHRHDPPATVYRLLQRLARCAPGPLTVIFERDGAHPDFGVQLAQLDAARAALARGRAEARDAWPLAARTAAPEVPAPSGQALDDARRLEVLLARAYTDAGWRERMLRGPVATAMALGCSADMAARLAHFDRAGLHFAARSVAHKRAARVRHHA